MKLKQYLMEMDIDKSQFLKKLGEPKKDIEKIIKPLKSIKRNPKKIKEVLGWFDQVFRLIGEYDKTLKDKDKTFKQTLFAFDAILTSISFVISELRSGLKAKEFEKWPEVKEAARKLFFYWEGNEKDLDYLMKVSG